MDLTQLKQLTLTVALLTLVGCATTSKTPGPVNSPSADAASVVGGAAVGTQVQLPPNNSLGLDSVVVDRTYFAASGRECRQLRKLDGSPLSRVVCKGSKGAWQFARDLSQASMNKSSASTQRSTSINDTDNTTVNNDQALVPSAGAVLLLEQDGTLSSSTDEVALLDQVDVTTTVEEQVGLDDLQVLAAVERELQVNETLWSFAQRTTGNPLNWQAIAELNGITDTNTLAPGTQLSIPAELVGQGG